MKRFYRNILLFFCCISFINIYTQSKDFILNERRFEFISLCILDNNLWVNGFIESRDTLRFKPFLAKINYNLNLINFFPNYADTNDVVTVGKLFLDSNHKFAFITNGIHYFKRINDKGEIEANKYYQTDFGTGVNSYSLWYSGLSQYLVDSIYFKYGYKHSSKSDNFVLEKINRNGDIVWSKIGSSNDTSSSSVGVSYGLNNIYLGINNYWEINNTEPFSKFSLNNYSQNGTLVSTKTLNNSKFSVDQFIQISNNSIILGGRLFSGNIMGLGIPSKSVIIKTDSNLDQLWEIKVGDSLNLFNKINKIIRLSNGNYIAIAYVTYGDSSCSDCSEMICFNEQGQILWRNRYKFSPNSIINEDEIKDIIELPNGDLICVGRTILNSLANSDTFRVQRGWILKTNKNGEAVSSVSSNISSSIIDVYPNPFIDKLSIHHHGHKNNEVSIDIFSSLGIKVFSKKIKLTDDKLDLFIDNLMPGFYYLKISDINENSQIIYKVQKLKL